MFVSEMLIVRHLNDVRMLQKLQVLEGTFELIHLRCSLGIELLLH